jgi:hypothetical protein
VTSQFWSVIKKHFIKKNRKSAKIKLAQTNNKEGCNSSGLIEDLQGLIFLYPSVVGSFRLNAPVFGKVFLVM